MATVALQQVSSVFAPANAKRTLEKRVALKFLAPCLDAEQRAKLEALCPDSALSVWGSKFERHHQIWKMLPKQCLMLFRRGQNIYKAGVVADKIHSQSLAERLWGFDTDGQTWSLIYFFPTLRDVAIPAVEVNRLLGYDDANHWQGLVVIDTEGAESVIELVKRKVRSNKSFERTE